MDNAILIAVIAVCGTLAGALLSTLGTYFVQSTRDKRETEREREKDKTQLRRELISKRLSVIEEAATLMMFLTGVRFDREYGAGSYCDAEMFRQKGTRIEEIYLEALTSSKAINSRELADAFGEMSSKYWEIDEGGIDQEDYDVISSNYNRVIKTIGDLIVNA